MKPNELNCVINGQVRKVEYFVDDNCVYLFDTKGDSTGFRFESDHRK